MTIRGIEAAKRRTTAIVGRITANSERAVTEVLIIGQGYAAAMTPVDTGNLINSQYREVHTGPNGIEGRVGYTAAYAAAVHEMSGKLKGQPRRDFGTTRSGQGFGGGTGQGNYWDPDAEPGFLRKAFEEDGKADIDAAIRRNMRL